MIDVAKPFDYESYFHTKEGRKALKGWNLKWSEYIPNKPTAKQLLFLMLPHREVFFGGAAGGGKSDALLMAALQYADVPTYAGIIFRRTFTDLALPEALMARSHEWLSDTDARWKDSEHTWYFPSGARLTFGYLDSPQVKYRYQSAAFQFIGFDELTQFQEEDFTYLFSRLRRRKTQARYGIPLRMRTTSNPAAINAAGYGWVKKRYQIRMVPNPIPGAKPLPRGFHHNRPFIPSFAVDNPFLDVNEYIGSLSELDPVTREQLLAGDWDIGPSGRFKKEWFRYYDQNIPRHYNLGPTRGMMTWKREQLIIFATLDPASSVREGPGDEFIWKREPSWTVLSVWGLTPTYDLLLLNVYRKQCEVPDIFNIIRESFQSDRWHFLAIEANSLGIGVFQQCRRDGYEVRAVYANSGDKLVRATPYINRMSQGKVFFPNPSTNPHAATWLDDWENEHIVWTCHPQQTTDQIDTGAYAGLYVIEQSGGMQNTTSAPEVLPWG